MPTNDPASSGTLKASAACGRISRAKPDAQSTPATTMPVVTVSTGSPVDSVSTGSRPQIVPMKMALRRAERTAFGGSGSLWALRLARSQPRMATKRVAQRAALQAAIDGKAGWPQPTIISKSEMTSAPADVTGVIWTIA